MPTSAETPHWPPYMPRQLVKPDTTLFANLEVAALRYASRTAIGFMGRDITYAELLASAMHFAGWLQQRANVGPGQRVMVLMQNAPQWLMAFYGALRADAVVVPANPMYKVDELAALLADSGAVVIVCSRELAETARAASRGTDVRAIVVTAYADYLPATPLFALPAWVTQAAPGSPEGCVAWNDVMRLALVPAAATARPDDLAVINYTSGSTGVPRGCMHTHRTFMHTTVGLSEWHGHPAGTVFLGAVPMYQVGGLLVGVNCAVFVGGTVVPVPRWERSLVVALIKHYRVRYAGIAPTALIDLLADPSLAAGDLSSVQRVSFGGATMPDSVWQTIHDRLGLEYVETYGMTETAATALINPIHRIKRQCLGIPFFDTDVRVIDLETGAECATGVAGEIAVHGPQLFKGYWNQPELTAASLIEIDGRTFFRSGDIGLVDDEGYFYMTDRLKRMINASGFKVWPAEVESVLHGHPAVKEVCVIATRDPYRGESVKAVVVLHDAHRGRIDAKAMIDWARARMAAFKYPREVVFVDALPKSAVGKILWREVQDAEAGADVGANVGANSSADSSADSSTNSSANAGANSSADSSAGSGTDAGVKAGADTIDRAPAHPTGPAPTPTPTTTPNP